MTRPPSASALRQYASDILNGKEGDWSITHLIESNHFYKLQVDELLMEPFKQAEYQEQQSLKAEQDALAKFRQKLKQTCYSYRSTRVTRAKLHYNRLPKLLQTRRNNLEKQGRWDKFIVDLQMFRISQALGWIDRRHSEWMTNVILSQSNPFELAEAWPEGSKCVIDPQMSKDWVLLEPPTPPTKIEVESSLRKRLLAYERALEAAYYKTLGITKPKPSITTTDSNGQRTTSRSDSGHTAQPGLTLEHWMEKQLRDEVSGAEEHSETGV